jgi:L-2-hydroxyglutarate oxidase LhgO
METVECVVIGAGIIGLAVARSIALAGHEVLVLEAAGAIGTETSSRNSEVIHAGIYYPATSLMARSCVAGRQALYAFCADRGVPHRKCGKLIVATTDAESERLGIIQRGEAANGVTDLKVLSAPEARALEAGLHCTGALYSPLTGIIDTHAYMLALQADLEGAGGILAFHCPFLGASPIADQLELSIGGSHPMTLQCRLLVNAAGLRAPAVARTSYNRPLSAKPATNFLPCS